MGQYYEFFSISLRLCSCWALILSPITTHAADIHWKPAPTDGDWLTPANWSEDVIPGPDDNAIFRRSRQTAISVADTLDVLSIDFLPEGSAYQVTVMPDKALNIVDGKINNESGVTQTFIAAAGEEGQGSFIQMQYGVSVLGPVQFISEANSIVWFLYGSDAGAATCTNLGGTVAGANGGETGFYDGKAAEATITNQAALVSGAFGGQTVFWTNSSAESATIISKGATVSGAGGGITSFIDSSQAREATLIAQGGGSGGGAIWFQNMSDGLGARIEVFGNGSLILNDRLTTLLSIGSLEGDGQVFLSTYQLSIGDSNLSTTFSGVIQDAGSIIKVGSGTLTLTGNNTYSGGTTVSAGSLKVDNRIGSATGRGTLRVNAGTLGGRGIIAGAVSVSAGAFLQPGVGASKPTTLTIESTLTFKADSTYTYNLNTKKAQADQVVANGVTIESGAQFNFSAVGNQKVTLGASFSAISNTSGNPISGAFANLPDGSTFTAGRNNFLVSYTGGDGNDLTLTVVP